MVIEVRRLLMLRVRMVVFVSQFKETVVRSVCVLLGVGVIPRLVRVARL